MGFWASAIGIRSFAQLAFVYGVVSIVTKQNDWTIFLWRWNRLHTSWKGCFDTMYFHDFHAFQKIWYFNSMGSPLLCRCCTAVLWPRLSRRLDTTTRPNSMATTFIRSDYFTREYLRELAFSEVPATKEEVIKESYRKSLNYYREHINNVYRSLENRLCLVLREWGGHFKHFLNW